MPGFSPCLTQFLVSVQPILDLSLDKVQAGISPLPRRVLRRDIRVDDFEGSLFSSLAMCTEFVMNPVGLRTGPCTDPTLPTGAVIPNWHMWVCTRWTSSLASSLLTKSRFQLVAYQGCSCTKYLFISRW